MTPETRALHELIDARRGESRALLAKYAATNPRLIGSVARGTAHAGSDTDAFPVQLLELAISESAIEDAVAL